jgi:hypothetical protein
VATILRDLPHRMKDDYLPRGEAHEIPRAWSVVLATEANAGPRNILPGRRQPSCAEAGPADSGAVAGGAAGLAAAACSISRVLVARAYIARISSFVIRDLSSASGGAGGAGSTYLFVGLPNA